MNFSYHIFYIFILVRVTRRRCCAHAFSVVFVFRTSFGLPIDDFLYFSFFVVHFWNAFAVTFCFFLLYLQFVAISANVMFPLLQQRLSIHTQLMETLFKPQNELVCCSCSTRTESNQAEPNRTAPNWTESCRVASHRIGMICKSENISRQLTTWLLPQPEGIPLGMGAERGRRTTPGGLKVFDEPGSIAIKTFLKCGYSSNWQLIKMQKLLPYAY